MKTKVSKKTTDTKDMDELKRMNDALQATQHNPVNFAPIIALVAPVIARIAVRFALRYLARKLNRKISGKIRDETVVGAADLIAGIVVKRTLKK